MVSRCFCSSFELAVFSLSGTRLMSYALLSFHVEATVSLLLPSFSPLSQFSQKRHQLFFGSPLASSLWISFIAALDAKQHCVHSCSFKSVGCVFILAHLSRLGAIVSHLSHLRYPCPASFDRRHGRLHPVWQQASVPASLDEAKPEMEGIVWRN